MTEPTPLEAFTEAFSAAPSAMEKFALMNTALTERQGLLNMLTAGDLTVTLHNMLFSSEISEGEIAATKRLTSLVVVHVLGILGKLGVDFHSLTGGNVHSLIDDVQPLLLEHFVVAERVPENHWQKVVESARKVQEEEADK